MGGRGGMTLLNERRSLEVLIEEAVAAGASKSKACKEIGLSMRTMQRWKHNVAGDKRPFIKNIPANKITPKEREEIIAVCCSERFRDMTPNEIVPILAEEGRYIASESTLYRILKEEKLDRHRSESKPRQKVGKPKELKATGPDQVFSWDITYLLSEIRGKYYYLYMFEDVWSRAIKGWDIHENESAKNASVLMRRICSESNISDIKLHSDNGSPMKGAAMLSTLQDLGVMPSFSRPRVSNDNPYSESLFKTLKYTAGYPKSFNLIEEAKAWVADFVEWYNNHHKHSGIKFVTPMQRHAGKDKEILSRRNKTYKETYKKHPERWSGDTRNWEWIPEVILNPDNKINEIINAA